ncbi:MAG: acyl-CoA dehydrogenase family protein [Candidatus Methanospirareceae archaeon]
MEGFPWWNEAQKKLSEEVDAFVDEIMPKAQELVWRRKYPRELVREVAKRGWFGALIPEEYGGKKKEWGATGCCIICEGLSRAPGLVYPYLLTQFGGTHQIEDFATEEKKKEWLPKIARGEITGAVSLTEPYVGSDAAAVETTAVREGDEYVINGKKRFGTNAGAADIYVVYARTSDKPEDIARHKHISAFIVEKGTKGFSVEKVNELIGFDNIYNACLDFEDVRVPVENRLGGEGDGWKVMMSGLNLERTLCSAGMLGYMRESLRYAVFHMERRVQFGQRTIDFEANQFKLADMIFTYNIARLLVYYTAYLLDLGIEPALEAATTKLFVTDHGFGMKLFNDAIQCMGGDGVTKFYPIECSLRDVKIMQIATGSNEIMRVILYGMGLRRLREALKPPRRKVHEELKVPVTVGFGGATSEKKEVKEEDVLNALAENYRVNPGLYMTMEDLKAELGIEVEELSKLLASLEEKGLVKLFKGRKGDIKLARASFLGLRKAKPLEEYKWFPGWVSKEDIF